MKVKAEVGILIKGALKVMAWTKAKTAIASAVVIGMATFSAIQYRTQVKLRGQNETLQRQWAGAMVITITGIFFGDNFDGSASRPIHDERLEVRELFSEELLLALPPGHPLIRKRIVNANDLADERLIV